MKQYFLFLFFLNIHFIYSQKKDSSIYYPQEQIIHFECEGYENTNICLYNLIKTKTLIILNKKVKNIKIKKDTLKVSIALSIDEIGKVNLSHGYIDIKNERLRKKSYKEIQSMLSNLAKFKVLNRKSDFYLSMHRFDFKFLVTKPHKTILLSFEENPDYKGGIVEETAIYPGCEGLPYLESKECFNKKMKEHIYHNFKYPEKALLGRIEGIVHIMFTIGKNGKKQDYRLKGAHSLLEEESLRIVELLPDFKPALQNGKPVRVSYSIPITFKL